MLVVITLFYDASIKRNVVDITYTFYDVIIKENVVAIIYTFMT